MSRGIIIQTWAMSTGRESPDPTSSTVNGGVPGLATDGVEIPPGATHFQWSAAPVAGFGDIPAAVSAYDLTLRRFTSLKIGTLDTAATYSLDLTGSDTIACDVTAEGFTTREQILDFFEDEIAAGPNGDEVDTLRVVSATDADEVLYLFGKGSSHQVEVSATGSGTWVAYATSNVQYHYLFARVGTHWMSIPTFTTPVGGFNGAEIEIPAGATRICAVMRAGSVSGDSGLTGYYRSALVQFVRRLP